MNEREKSSANRNYCRYNNTGTDNDSLYNEEFPGVLELYKLEGIFLIWQPLRYVHEIRGPKKTRKEGKKEDGGVRDGKYLKHFAEDIDILKFYQPDLEIEREKKREKESSTNLATEILEREYKTAIYKKLDVRNKCQVHVKVKISMYKQRHDVNSDINISSIFYNNSRIKIVRWLLSTRIQFLIFWARKEEQRERRKIGAGRKVERRIVIHLNVGHFIISHLDILQRTLKAAP